MKTADQIALYRQIDALPEDYDEPENEEIGIEPYTGWRMALIAAGLLGSSVALIAWLVVHMVEIFKHWMGG